MLVDDNDDDADNDDRRGGKKKTDWFGAVNGLIIVLFVTVKKDLSYFYHQLLNETKRVKLCYFFAKNITLGKKVYGQVARKSCRPKFLVKAPKMLSSVG